MKDITYFISAITVIGFVGYILNGFFEGQLVSIFMISSFIVFWLIWITLNIISLRNRIDTSKDIMKNLKAETEIIRPFPEVRDINSIKKNSYKTSSEFIMWEQGTVMCWVYVNPEGEGIRDRQNNHYILGHITKAESNSIYYNRFSIGCLGKSNPKRWEVTLTNNKAEQSTLPIQDKLVTGWHHFMCSWNRKKNEMNFLIDKGEKGNNFSQSMMYWPEKAGDKLVIGAWASDHEGHYCNTKIAFPEIINKYLSHDSPEVIDNYAKKTKLI